MSLRGKLILAFISMTALLVLLSSFAARQLGQMRDLAVEGRSSHATAVTQIGRMQALVAELDRLERSFIATADSIIGRDALATLDSLRQTERRFRSGPMGALETNLGGAIGKAGDVSLRIEQLMHEGELLQATDSFGLLMTRLREVERELTNAAERIDKRAREDALRADAMRRAATARTLALIAVALLLMITLAIVTTRILSRPIRQLSRSMAHLAEGSFDTPADLPYQRKDEIGELSNSFATMARRLAQVDRMRCEFFGIVSHELKTPLNVIGAYAEMLHDELEGDRSDHRRRLLHEINEQCEIMLKRVCRLMDISRLAAGTYELAPERVGTSELVTSLRKAWLRRAEDKGVTFTVVSSGTIPAHVVMDVDIIRDEVLGNLVVNALRFTPTGGRIDVVLTPWNEGIAFTVTDTGPGIAEEHRELVFQKHYVIDRRSAVGSGLGLAIAREMVELHGGRIALESPAPGRGAQFVVQLPASPPARDLDLPGPAIIARRAPTSTELPADALDRLGPLPSVAT